jgi:hypothetical protein
MGRIILILIYFVIIYLAYQMGRLKGKAEMFLSQTQKPGRGKEKVEEADFEEIK